MNSMYNPAFLSLRHRELIAESEQQRRRSAVRRVAKAARLNRRAEQLTRRAAELVERTHE